MRVQVLSGQGMAGSSLTLTPLVHGSLRHAPLPLASPARLTCISPPSLVELTPSLSHTQLFRRENPRSGASSQGRGEPGHRLGAPRQLHATLHQLSRDPQAGSGSLGCRGLGLKDFEGHSPNRRHVRAESLLSCLTLCEFMDCILPGSSVHGILQGRILEWVAISSPGDLPHTGIEPTSLYISCIGRQVL